MNAQRGHLLVGFSEHCCWGGCDRLLLSLVTLVIAAIDILNPGVIAA
jgi:hypothetical protein